MSGPWPTESPTHAKLAGCSAPTWKVPGLVRARPVAGSTGWHCRRRVRDPGSPAMARLLRALLRRPSRHTSAMRPPKRGLLFPALRAGAEAAAPPTNPCCCSPENCCWFAQPGSEVLRLRNPRTVSPTRVDIDAMICLIECAQIVYVRGVSTLFAACDSANRPETLSSKSSLVYTRGSHITPDWPGAEDLRYSILTLRTALKLKAR